MSTNVSPLIWMYVFRMMPASVGSANAMNDTDIVCRARGLSVIRSTCLSGRMRTREHTQGYTASIAERNKQTLDHLHAWTLRPCSDCGFPSEKQRYPRLVKPSTVVVRRLSRSEHKTTPELLESKSGQMPSKCEMSRETNANTYKKRIRTTSKPRLKMVALGCGCVSILCRV